MENNDDKILVIGATGHIGRALIDRLGKSVNQSPLRALVRRPSAAKFSAGVEVVAGDLTDLDSLEAALAGVGRVFLIWPLGNAESADAVVSVIARSVRRVVYLSAIGVRDDSAEAPDPILQFHTDIERTLRATQMEWTFVRSGGMATNTLGWAGQVRASSTVRWVYGDAARALTHEADLAEIAETALVTDRLIGAAPQITGSSVLTQREQAAQIGSAIGRPVTWFEVPIDDARDRLMASGWSRAMADGALRAWAHTIDNPEVPTDDFFDITGRAARDFRRWTIDHAEDFR
ncbi:NAD(P)H-binding protein [Microbacterium sp. NPDC089698]|uniref:NAD(P)H-binding protein n=1 Tax=Microbacterium sp. NPDC089698 TaxID=3364200 RepID=UPI00381BDABC